MRESTRQSGCGFAEDKQPACPSLTVMETREGYQQLQRQLEELHR